MALKKIFSRVHVKLGDLWWYTLLGFIVNRLGEIVNFYIGAILVPRLVPQEEMGAVNPLMSVASFVALPIAIALLPVGKFLNVFAARKEYGKVRALLTDSLLISALFAVVILIWLGVTGDSLLERMHLSDRRILIPIAGFALISCIGPTIDSAQRSLKCFKGMLWAGLTSPYVRLVAMLLLLAPFGAFGYLSAQLTLNVYNFLFGAIVLLLVFRKLGPRVSYWPNWKEMLAYSLPLLAWTFAGRIQGPVESFVIRRWLPTDVSAGFYYATIFGNIPGYATSALVLFFWPLVSERFEKGQSTEKLLLQSMIFNFLVGGLAILAIAIVIPYVFALPGPWAGYESYSRFVWQAGFLTLLKSVQALFTSHESACRRFTYVWYMVPLMLLESAVLYALPAWQVVEPYLPHAIWAFIDRIWETNLQNLLTATILFNVLFTLVMIFDWLVLIPRAKAKKAAVKTC